MAAPLLIMPPAPPSLVQAGLNTLIYRTLLDITIADGSHAALHSLVNLERRGAWGSAAMHNLEAEWTRGATARAKARYAENHFDNAFSAHGWADAIVLEPLPWGTSTATRDAVAGCTLCFRYLCQKKVIKPEGFFPNRKSFLFEAAAAKNVRLVQYIIDEMPDHVMFEDQDVFQPGLGGAMGESSVMNSCSEFEAPFRKLVARMQELEQSSPARFGYLITRSVAMEHSLMGGNMYLTKTSQSHISKYIDVTLAKQLFAWGLHPGAWIFNGDESTTYSQMLEFQNPHRCSMFRWMDKNPFSIGAMGFASTTLVNSACSTIGLGIPDLYPPLGMAMWMGDVAATVTLCRFRDINLVETGVPGPAYVDDGGVPPPYLCGRAAVEHFTLTHLRLLTHWLRCAAWDLEREDRVDDIMVILEHLLDCIEKRRFELKTAAVPIGANVKAFREANKRTMKEETNIAISMIHAIIGIPFRYLVGDDDGVPSRRSSILENEDYQSWLADVRGNKRGRGRYRDCVAVLAALERPPDKRTLRSLNEQVMDWD